MKDEDCDKILNVFKKAGMKIEMGATFSVRGQVAELLNGIKEMEIAYPEEELDRSYKIGICSGLEKAATYLMGIATQKFEAGDDFSANSLRENSRFFSSQAVKEHPGVPETNQ